MEKSVTKMFENVDQSLTDEERLSRIDIKHTTAQGKHVIVELKKADRVVNTDEVRTQLDKYRRAFEKVARLHEDPMKPLELICIVGRDLSGWVDAREREITARTLAPIGGRVVYISTADS